MAGGKFKKPQRGGGRKFSRHIQAVHSNSSRPNADEDKEDSSSSDSESSATQALDNPDNSGSEEDPVPAKNATLSSDEEDPTSALPANPNHLTATARRQQQKSKAVDMSMPIEMSRKEREAAEKEAAKQRYWKLHQEGKTDEAKSDMARLAVIRKQREEAAAKRLAEAKAKDEAMAAKMGFLNLDR